MIESQKIKSFKALCTDYCSDSFEDENNRISLLGNTNELQDFISDLHSYPAALYKFHYIIISNGISL